MTWRELPPMTRPYAEVIGDPIAQSKSPLIHRFWLDRLGIDADYRAAHVRPGEVGAYLAARRADPLWRGSNVTMPHKQEAYRLADARLGGAKKLHAANTLYPADAGVAAQNTDINGVQHALKGHELAGKRAVVIGAGGAAAAVLAALGAFDVFDVVILNRTAEKAEALLTASGLGGRAAQLTQKVAAADILINASSLGMTGQAPLDVDISALPDHAVVHDIVYSPLKTDLLKAAEARGLIAIDGLGMLIGQALAAFRIFFAPERDPDGEDELRRLLTS